MDLETAQGVKRELQTFLDSESVSSRGVRIGLGIAPASRPGQYNIAVRARSDDILPRDIVETLRVKTAHEIDVRVTGTIKVRLPAVIDTPQPFPTFMFLPPRPAGFADILVRGSGGSGGDRLTIGASVGHYRTSAGTLGFFARRRADGAVGIVSNNHVLAAEDRGIDRDDVLHPAPADRGQRPKNVVATLCGTYPRLKGGGAAVDCAFAVLRREVTYDPSALHMGQTLGSVLSPAEGQGEVSKIGRTTLRTHGRITAFELDSVDVDYSFGPLRFGAQIEIESSSRLPFSRPGDSGSLIFGPEGHALGLLFAMSAIGGTLSTGLSYAHPIGAVLDALDVTLFT